ncbi:MAG: hypothetical protein DDT33_01683 [Firmicutes bacterium]|nr:hypothetical protein [Bacillota bacterium]
MRSYRGIIEGRGSANREKLPRTWTTNWYSTYKEALEISKLLRKYEYSNSASITIDTRCVVRRQKKFFETP